MDFKVRLLEHYHITLNDLAKRNAARSFVDLKTPYELSDFQAVCSRIEQAIKNNEKIVIYGDYDVDGITSVTILKRMFDSFSYPVGYFVPSRYKEGYGLNESRVKEFKEKGYQLIICVDNGVKAYGSIHLAKTLGMDVIVIDHHEIEKPLPEADSVFHHRESGFLDYDCSAASLCFFVSSYFRKRFDKIDAILAGTAVFSDVMPLIGNNLVLANMLPELIKSCSYKPYLSLLAGKEVSYDNITMSLIPALNAPGRVKEDSMATNNCVRYLLCEDDEKTLAKLLSGINDANELKKKYRKETSYESVMESDNSYVAICNAPSGMTGLLANNLMNEKKVPVIVFSKDPLNEDVIVGSIRMPDCYSTLPFFEKYGKYIVKFGGHEKAAGLSILKKDYIQVATLFALECSLQSLNAKKPTDDSIEVALDDLNEDNYRIYEMFEPFGESFIKPSFSIIASKEEFVPSRNGNAFFVYSSKSKATCFRTIDSLSASINGRYRLIGDFSKNVFRGNTSYGLDVRKIETDD